MTGGAFMGVMLAQQGGGSDFDPDRTYFVIDSVSTGATQYRTCTIYTEAGCTTDWGDGTTSTMVYGSSMSHTYDAGTGPWTVEICGSPRNLGIDSQSSLKVSKVNIGDSVVDIGSGFRVGLFFGGANIVAGEILGMRNVETIGNFIEIPFIKRFAFPPKIETCTINGLTFRHLEEFSLGNIKYFDQDRTTTSHSAKKWLLGTVERLDFRGITQLGDASDCAPCLSDNTNLVWVHWGKLKILPTASTGYGTFKGCTKLTQVLHDADSPFSTASNTNSTFTFDSCSSLVEMPIDISDASSVDVISTRIFSRMYDNCPHLFPDHKATIAVVKFDADCASYCGITDLTLDGGDTPTECRITSGLMGGYVGIKKLTLINVFSTATSAQIAGTAIDTIEEVVFPAHTTYSYAPRFFYQAKNYAHQVVAKYPTHTMDEVKNLVRYGRDVKDFPFGAPADTPVSKLYFQCKDGNMDVQGNVIQ